MPLRGPPPYPSLKDLKEDHLREIEEEIVKGPLKKPLIVPKDIIKVDLRTPKYRLRVIKDRTKYDRKRVPKVDTRGIESGTEAGPKVELWGPMFVEKI